MFRDFKNRLIIIILLAVTAMYFVWPTYKLYSATNNLTSSQIEELKSKAIKLGLDLQGGMYVLLEIDLAILVNKLSNNPSDELNEIIEIAKKESISNNYSFFDAFLNQAEINNLRLSKYYINLTKNLNRSTRIKSMNIIELIFFLQNGKHCKNSYLRYKT